MDINDLWLTDDEVDAECDAVGWRGGLDDNTNDPRLGIANAATAKTLRVLIDWLHTTDAENEPPFTSRNAFRDALLELLEAAEAKTPVEAI